MNAEAKPRVFSGVQPTGNLHLGNYLGAIRNWVGLQEDYECIYCMVDLHAITVPQDPAALRAHTLEVTASLLAAGIESDRSVVFVQNQVSGHAELAWIFNCVAKMGWLSRMTQFKDKAGKHRENASAGLFVYPNLMAADILLYMAGHVPVGEDQKQHLELVRDIAQSFNHQYGLDHFPVVEPLIFGSATRVMSLRDGTAKMSKSDASDYSRINLTDGADDIALKIRKARTDPDPLPGAAEGLRERPEARNLVSIYAALANRSVDDVCAEYDGAAFSKFKEALAELAIAELAPITTEVSRLLDDRGAIEDVLRAGAERARAMAVPNLARVKEIIGFLTF